MLFASCWVPSYLAYDLCLFLPWVRAYVSVSNGFPIGVGDFSNPALKRLRSGHLLVVSTTNESHLESYPVPIIRFALR